MGSEFFDVCERLDPDIEAKHRKVAVQCMEMILGDRERAEVFLLALEGLLADQPAAEVMERRTRVLADQFLPSTTKKGMP